MSASAQRRGGKRNGGHNNDITLRSMPKQKPELVTIPLLWDDRRKRFAYPTGFPWQLKGIIRPEGTHPSSSTTITSANPHPFPTQSMQEPSPASTVPSAPRPKSVASLLASSVAAAAPCAAPLVKYTAKPTPNPTPSPHTSVTPVHTRAAQQTSSSL